MNPENGGIENGSVGGIDRDSADRRMVFLAGYQQWPGMDVPIPFGRNTAVAEFGRRAGEKGRRLLLLKGGWKNVFNDVDSGFCDRMHLSADRLSDHCCGCIHGSGGVSDPCRDPMRSGISCNECMDDLQLIWRKDQWDIIIRL